MDRRMWVIVVLLLAGGTIVAVRLFRNGARAEDGPEAIEEPAPPRARSAVPSRRAAATAVASRSPSTSAKAPAPERAWPGGNCPACGTATVPGAKFCGECGHRLVP